MCRIESHCWRRHYLETGSKQDSVLILSHRWPSLSHIDDPLCFRNKHGQMSCSLFLTGSFFPLYWELAGTSCTKTNSSLIKRLDAENRIINIKKKIQLKSKPLFGERLLRYKSNEKNYKRKIDEFKCTDKFNHKQFLQSNYNLSNKLVKYLQQIWWTKG